MPASMRYPRKWEWPNQAKIALSMNLALEAFRFKSQYTQEGKPGRVDHFSLSYAAPSLFGARKPDFERDLRTMLRRASPQRRFCEQPRGIRVDVWRTVA